LGVPAGSHSSPGCRTPSPHPAGARPLRVGNTGLGLEEPLVPRLVAWLAPGVAALGGGAPPGSPRALIELVVARPVPFGPTRSPASSVPPCGAPGALGCVVPGSTAARSRCPGTASAPTPGAGCADGAASRMDARSSARCFQRLSEKSCSGGATSFDAAEAWLAALPVGSPCSGSTLLPRRPAAIASPASASAPRPPMIFARVESS